MENTYTKPHIYTLPDTVSQRLRMIARMQEQWVNTDNIISHMANRVMNLLIEQEYKKLQK